MEIFILCVTILVCRVIDVALATIRSVFNIKGKKMIASVVGFTEALIWFLVVRQALDVQTGGIYVALAFSFGFAIGTYVGGLIVAKVDRGNIQVQIITSVANKQLIKILRDQGYAVTVVDVKKSEFSEEKIMLFLEVMNNHFLAIKQIIQDVDEKAFIMVHESKTVINGFFTRK